MKNLLLQVMLTVSIMANVGHRLGGDIYPPENTLVAYKKLLSNNQCDDALKYVELDVCETQDGEIIVFHDMTLSRVVPKTPQNIEVLQGYDFDVVKIKDLPLRILKKLDLGDGAKIPTLKEVLDVSIAHKLKKQMLIEIKYFHSDAARYDLINLVSSYRDRLWVNFIAGDRFFFSSFPDDIKWFPEFKKHGFFVFRTFHPKIRENDLLQREVYDSTEWRSRTLLSESNFIFTKFRGRKQEFRIESRYVPRGSILRIGIEHGYDNSADKGVTFKLVDNQKNSLFEGFADYQTWQWFDLPVSSVKNLKLVIEDLDTDFSNAYPGNGGKVKVILISPR